MASKSIDELLEKYKFTELEILSLSVEIKEIKETGYFIKEQASSHYNKKTTKREITCQEWREL